MSEGGDVHGGGGEVGERGEHGRGERDGGWLGTLRQFCRATKNVKNIIISLTHTCVH